MAGSVPPPAAGGSVHLSGLPAGAVVEREALEERRLKLRAELVEVERRRAAAELDDAAAERLARRYEDELAETLDALRRLDPGAGWTARRVWIASTMVVAAVAVAGVAAAGLLGDDGDRGRPSTAAGRELSGVSNEEMEEVIAANPQVVRMRLALVERYLRDGESAKAQAHAAEALERAGTAGERQRALKYLGWATAIEGDAAEGARLLEQALELDPSDRDARWFLANVRLQGLGDAAGAIELLESLLAQPDLPADKRTVIEDRLAQARNTAPASSGPLPTP